MWSSLSAFLRRAAALLRGHTAKRPRVAKPRAPRLPAAGVADGYAIDVVALSLEDDWRRREVPLRVTFPVDASQSFPVIVFSHGAWGSRDGFALLTQHWASHGYVCLQPTHSDALGPRERPDPERLREWASRPKDVSFLLDSLDLLEIEIPELSGRLDSGCIGVGGHSFGAGTAQIIAGASVSGPRRRKEFRDPRVRAALLLSPQGSGELHDAQSWSELRMPMMTVTGTLDHGRGGDYSWRLEPFQRAPAGDKYLIVIEGGEHDYGGISRAASPRGYDERQVLIVQHVSLAFWDAHLKRDEGAQRFLNDGGLQAMLGADAKIERK